MMQLQDISHIAPYKVTLWVTIEKFKGTVYPKIIILSSFTHSNISANLWKIHAYHESHQEFSVVLHPIDFHCVDKNCWNIIQNMKRKF